MIEYSHRGQVPPLGDGMLKGFRNAEVLERTYISPRVDNDVLVYITAIGVNEEYLRKIIFQLAVRNFRGLLLYRRVRHREIPGVLRFDKRVAAFIGVFVQHPKKRIEVLEGRPVNSST